MFPTGERSPGVLESMADLDDEIKALSRNPARFDSQAVQHRLAELYLLGGAGAARATLDRCTRIIRDPSEGQASKVVAVRILNLLMQANDDALAKAVATEVRFFTGIAKKLRDKEKRKRKSGQDDTLQHAVAVAEFMDKWGRHYAHVNPLDALAQIPRARRELMDEQVKLPTPDAYRFIEASTALGGENAQPAATWGGTSPAQQGFGHGHGTHGLDEQRLGRLADEARTAVQRGHMEAEALSSLEAELQTWRRAIEEAVERGDFAEVERLSEITHRFANIKDGIESSASASRAASPSPTPHQSISPPPTHGSDHGRKEKKEKKHKDRSRDGSPHRHHHGGAGDWAAGGGFPGGAGPGGFGTGAADLAAAGGWGAGDVAGTGYSMPCASGPIAPAAAPFGGPVAHPDHASVAWAHSLGPETVAGSYAHSTAGPPGSYGPYGGQDMGAGSHYVETIGSFGPGSPSSPQSDLHRMAQRIHELEPLQTELADARATCHALREVNAQLQGEVERLQRELRDAKRRAATAEDQLREREETITQTRQRLFDAKHRTAQLEDEVKNQSEVHQALQGRLQSARQQSAATELELRSLRQTMQGVQDWRLPFTEALRTQPQGNVPYTRSLRSLHELTLASNSSSGEVAPAQKVNESDELATARPQSPRQDGAGDLPLQQLARRSRQAGSAGAITARGDFAGGDFPGGFGSPPASLRAPMPAVARSSAEAWRSAPRIPRVPPVLTSQPQRPPEVVERVHDNFRRLLAESRGPLYEDSMVHLEMSISPSSSSGGRPAIMFDMAIVNVSTHTIHEVQCRPVDPSRTHACELAVGLADARGATGGGARGTLGRQQRVCFRGQLSVFAPFESVPQLELSYLMPDDLGLRARLRLPLLLTRFMAAPKTPLDPASVVELWESPDFVHAEVAFVCTVRASLLGTGAPFSVWRCLELGGTFLSLPGVDGNPRGAILASSYPQRPDAPQSVLLRAELGGPASGPGGTASLNGGTPEMALCRVAVRSASHLVNRGTAQAALEALCEGGG